MSEWVVWVFLIGMTYRLSILLAVEEGPFSIFFWLRNRLGAYTYAENGEPETLAGRLSSCPLCVGIYIAFVAAIVAGWMRVYPLRIDYFVIVWLGIAGIQAFLYRLENR